MKTSGDNESALLQLFLSHKRHKTEDKARTDGSVNVVKNALE
jgi:hypothetical protein